MNFYTTLAAIIQESNLSKKFSLFETFFDAFKKGETFFEACETLSFLQPSYASFCHIIDPKDVPKRKRLSTLEGRVIFLHAIAHIEYSAIDLALDAAYRFRGMPQEYYFDWLEVAEDEIRHFKMLTALLEKLGSFYGALPVHDALFEAGVNTNGSLIERMAVVPRFMEANGLDANPKLIAKLKPFESEAVVAEMISALELILKEEVDHVRKGDRWFAYACASEGIDKSVYFEIIKKYYPRTFPRMHSINVDARKEAGFSCSELKQMADVEC